MSIIFYNKISHCLNACKSYSYFHGVHGVLGMSLPSAVGNWEHCDTDGPDDYLCARWGDTATVHMRAGKDLSRCTRIEWTSTFAREIEDCYDLDPQVHWYCGGEMYTQIWPIETRPRQEGPYITADAMADFEGEFGGVLENYWLLSSGTALIIDPDTPLHFSLTSTHPDRVCFVSRDHTPFTKRSPLTMNYEWCTGANIKEAHQFAMSTFFGTPTGIPDEEMLIRPVWSTWAEYKLEVNQSIVLDFAREVVSQGFGNASHIEIDDMQVNIFTPAVQFSIVPWKYDAETVQICLDVLAQREKYRETILAAARQTVIDGSPINRPIWWTAPNDTVTYTIDDAYMLGDTIMVAPVVEEGAVTRDIYLPEGTWASGGESSDMYTGPLWLRDYPAPLNVVPFFIKSN